MKSHDLATFDRQWAESRALLGDRLRLYQVHSVTPDSPLLTDEVLLRRLAGLREQGVEVGASTWPGPAGGDPPAAGGDRGRGTAAVLGAGDLEPAGALRR